MRYYAIISVVIAAAASVVGLPGWSGSGVPNQTREGVPGEIIGRVIDSEGQPVWKARVHLGTTKFGLPNGRVIFYPTDANGNFSIRDLAPDEYDVFVVKEEDRHPDTAIHFYSDKEVAVPKVVVSKTEPTPFVTVQTGPRAAVISGRVINAINGRPISSGVGVTFNRAEDKRIFLMTGPNQIKRPGGFSFLLPAAPVTMRVDAPGYQTWSYRKTGATAQVNLLIAAPGETIQMDVKMKPLKQRAAP